MAGMDFENAPFHFMCKNSSGIQMSNGWKGECVRISRVIASLEAVEVAGVENENVKSLLGMGLGGESIFLQKHPP